MLVFRLRPWILIASLLAVALPGPSWSLENSRLWLPTKYRGHYLKLRDAALAAEATDKCTEVLRGTLDLDLSSDEQSFYRVLCRQADGTTYSEVVDGSTLRPRSLDEDVPPPESPQERERRLAEAAAKAEQERLAAEEEAKKAKERARREAERAAAEAKAEAERTAQREARERRLRAQVLEGICRSEILARTSMMMNLQWITDKPVPEELENGQLRFHVEFDAENLWGKKLQYAAVCTISTPRELVVVVSPR
jgi:hypothetical protein